MKLTKLSKALGLAGALFAAQASAALIVTTGSDATYNYWYFNDTTVTGNDAATDIQAGVQCLIGQCALLVSGQLGNSSVSTEVALLNTVIEPDVSASDYSQTQAAQIGSNSFAISSKYFMLKFGDAADAWFQNLLFDDSVNISLFPTAPNGDEIRYSGGGLSHVTGGVGTEVPLPGTLGLLGLGLAGLGAIRRKKSV